MLDKSEPKESKGGSGISNLFFLALLLPLGALTAASVYLLLRKGKQRITVIFSAVLCIELGTLIAWLILNPLSKVIEVVTDLGAISENWPKLLPILILFNIALGAVVGLFFAMWDVRQMRVNPYRVLLEGNWMYNFEFARTPLEKLRRKKLIQGLRDGTFADPAKAPLGLDEEREIVAYRHNTEAAKQTLVAGASGSGKTITLLSMILNNIESGDPVIVIDFKRSPELASKIATWTKEANGKFYHFVNGTPRSYDVKNSPGQSFYDPLKNGSSTSKADMVLGMREYDTASAVYKAAMQQLLQVLFSMLKYADRAKAPSIDWAGGGISQVASAVTGGNLTELAMACEGTPIQAEAEAIEAMSKGKTQIKHAMEELQGQMRTIVASEYGRWLKQSNEGENIDMFELTQESGNVILFSLNSDDEPDFARYVGSMILANLTGVSAKRRNAKMSNQVNVYVDEFQAVPPTSVTSLLEKSRESKIAMTLAQQSFEQIIAASDKNGEAYLLSILDTCSNFIIHNGSTEDSAERLSKILGKHWVTVYKQSNQNESSFLSTNWGNKRNQTVQTDKAERWIFEPRQFMDLSSPDKNNNFKSTAVIINKTTSDPYFKDRTGGALARKIWMIPNTKVIDEYYTPTFDGEDDDGYQKPVKAIPLTSEEILQAENTPTSQEDEYDYFADYRNTLQSGSNENAKEYYRDSNEPEFDDYDEEKEDGEFGWSSLDDEEDSELMEAIKLPEKPIIDRQKIKEVPKVRKIIEEKRIETTRRSTMESSSFGSIYKSDFKPETRAGSNTKPHIDKKESKPALNNNPADNQIDFDEFELPDITF